jgi:protein-S-isoprenylcysteine O-methyltransferase Ste14
MKARARLFVLIQFVLFALLAAAYALLPTGQVLWARLLGITLAAPGLGLIGLSILTHTWVNRNLVNISPEPNGSNKLVQTGIYAYIRHPIYTGVMLAALGTALVHGHILALLIALALCAFFAYKSTFEDQLLMQVYPEYAAYRQRVGRFLPRLFQ